MDELKIGSPERILSAEEQKEKEVFKKKLLEVIDHDLSYLSLGYDSEIDEEIIGYPDNFGDIEDEIEKRIDEAYQKKSDKKYVQTQLCSIEVKNESNYAMAKRLGPKFDDFSGKTLDAFVSGLKKLVDENYDLHNAYHNEPIEKDEKKPSQPEIDSESLRKQKQREEEEKRAKALAEAAAQKKAEDLKYLNEYRAKALKEYQLTHPYQEPEPRKFYGKSPKEKADDEKAAAAEETKSKFGKFLKGIGSFFRRKKEND
jgi:hypothetical protein